MKILFTQGIKPILEFIGNKKTDTGNTEVATSLTLYYYLLLWHSQNYSVFYK